MPVKDAEVESEHGYLMDPHTAVGYLALRDVLTGEDDATFGIVLATAHPAKFGEIVEAAIGQPIPMPGSLAGALDREPSRQDSCDARQVREASLRGVWSPAG